MIKIPLLARPRKGGIQTLAQLQAHLQTALELELTTIPAYLFALYSIPDGQNLLAAELIRQVVVEEMLHLCLVANTINAVGGSPSIGSQGFIPTYPLQLPHSGNGLVVKLLPFSEAAIDEFCAVEHPQSKDSPPQPDHYSSIGQFYDAIREGILAVFGEGKILPGNPAYQIAPEHYYNSGGKLYRVYNIPTAMSAMNEIIHQGEGAKQSIKISRRTNELSHFARFREIRFARKYRDGQSPLDRPDGERFPVDWNSTYPVKPQITMADYPRGSALWARANEFNRRYVGLLDSLEVAFRGKPDAIALTVPAMIALKHTAVDLMRLPLGDGRFTAGPTFERPLSD